MLVVSRLRDLLLSVPPYRVDAKHIHCPHYAPSSRRCSYAQRTRKSACFRAITISVAFSSNHCRVLMRYFGQVTDTASCARIWVSLPFVRDHHTLSSAIFIHSDSRFLGDLFVLVNSCLHHSIVPRVRSSVIIILMMMIIVPNIRYFCYSSPAFFIIIYDITQCLWIMITVLLSFSFHLIRIKQIDHTYNSLFGLFIRPIFKITRQERPPVGGIWRNATPLKLSILAHILWDRNETSLEANPS